MRTLFVRRLCLRVFTLCVVAMCIGPHSSALASHSVGSETKMLWVNDSGTKAFGWVTIWGDAAEEYESRHHWVIYGASGKRLVSGGRGVLLEVSYIVLPEFCDLKLTQLMRTPDTADHYLEDWVWDTAPPFLSPEDYEFAGKGAPPTPDQSPWLRDLLKRHSLNHPLVMRRRSADDMIWFSCVEILDPDSDEEDEDEEDEDEYPLETLEEPKVQCRFAACASPGVGCRKGIKTNPGSKIPGFTGPEGSLPGGDLFWHPTRPIAVLNMSLNYWDEAVEVSESSIRIFNFEKIEGPHRK